MNNSERVSWCLGALIIGSLVSLALWAMLFAACATVPPPVAALPDTVTTTDLARMCANGACVQDDAARPTVLFGHEVDTANDAVLVCRWFPREGSLLCLPYSEEIEQ